MIVSNALRKKKSDTKIGDLLKCILIYWFGEKKKKKKPQPKKQPPETDLKAIHSSHAIPLFSNSLEVKLGFRQSDNLSKQL